MVDFNRDILGIGQIIKEEKKGDILLPNYQRPFIWKIENQRNLLISLILGLPIGGFLMSIGESDTYHSRALCYGFAVKKDKEKKVNFLLDGQQRLSALKSMFSDLFHEDTYKGYLQDKNYKPIDLIKGENRALPKNLCNRWFLDLTNDKSECSFTEIEVNIRKLDIDAMKVQEDIFLSIEDYEDMVSHEVVCNQGSTKQKPFSGLSVDSEILYDKCVRDKLIPLWLAISDMEAKGQNAPYRFINGKPLKNIITAIIGDIITNVYSNLEDREKEDKKDELKDIIENFFDRSLRQTTIPIQVISQEDEYKLITIFNQVNTGGVSLSTYDLVASRYGGAKGTNLNKQVRYRAS